jgi:hypothetical protein
LGAEVVEDKDEDEVMVEEVNEGGDEDEDEDKDDPGLEKLEWTRVRFLPVEWKSTNCFLLNPKLEFSACVFRFIRL